MNTTVQEVKPPPLHEWEDVFEEIVTEYHGGNNLYLVQERYRGACQLLTGTAIPKSHDALHLCVESNARLIGLADDNTTDRDIHAALTWIESERERHEKEAAAKAATLKSARRSIDDKDSADTSPFPACSAPIVEREDLGLPSDSNPPPM